MGSAVKLLLAVYRLQQGQTLKSRGVCASSKLCPPRSSPIAAEPARTKGVQTAAARKETLPRYREQFDSRSLIID